MGFISGAGLCAVGGRLDVAIQTKPRGCRPQKLASVSNIIWETCKTYLFQQGKFLAASGPYRHLHGLYFKGLQEKPLGAVLVILASSVVEFSQLRVAWFGIRINTTANSRARLPRSGRFTQNTFSFRCRPHEHRLLLVCVDSPA